MRKHPAAAFLVGLLVLGLSVPAAVALTGGSDDRPVLAGQSSDDSSSTSTPSTSTSSTSTSSTVPEIDGVDEDEPGEISGPCDEAEHANDPRCTGAPGTVTDNRGPGNATADNDNDDDNDDN